MANKREILIERYAEDLKKKCGITPDMDLLKEVTISCGPSIFRADTDTVSATSEKEMATVRKFLINKLSLPDNAKLDEGMDIVIEQYGRSNRKKYRAVVYYLLTVYFKKKSVK